MGDGSILTLSDVVAVVDLPLGMAKGESAEFRVSGVSLAFGVDPEIVC